MFEQQTSVETETSFYKKVVKIVSEAGIQNASEVSVVFNPAFEKLFIHNILIIRDGKTISKLDAKKIKIIQTETELDRSLYNGSLTAVLFLEDIRKGDIIEYSYSIKGFNPIFKGKFSEVFVTTYYVPIYLMYFKIVSPSSKKLNIRDVDGKSKVKESIIANQNIYEWKFTNIKPFRSEDQLPVWYRGYSKIIISEFDNWQFVNDWAKTLFPKDIPISKELEQKIKAIKSNNITKQTMVSEALRFVQDDIRYMGIEIGAHSHLPYNPNKVFSQRFGNCKDKSYLLCVMLRKMGIEADPVLTNSSLKKEIYKLLPSYQNFNHCTVRVKIDNNIFFLDPTISYQRGYLNLLSFPDYQVGLVITDTTTRLTEIPLQESGEVKVKEIFTLLDLKGNGTLEVQSAYSGTYGDQMRNSFKNNSLYEMQKNFRDFYAFPFKNIAIKDSLKIEDDEVNGIFSITETYFIKKIWNESKTGKEISFYPYVITNILNEPKEKERRMPLGFTFPLKYKEEIIINLPEPWGLELNSYLFDCKDFKLNSSFSFNTAKTVAYLTYNYETFNDHVALENTAKAIQAIENFKDNMYYQISYSQSGKVNSSNNEKQKNPESPFVGRFILFYLVIVIVLAVFFTLKKRKKSRLM